MCIVFLYNNLFFRHALKRNFLRGTFVARGVKALNKHNDIVIKRYVLLFCIVFLII